MRNVTRGQLLFLCAACFALGSLTGLRRPAGLLAEPVAVPKAPAVPFPMMARLGGNLYLQQSAEYKACCWQIYKCAELRLQASLDAAPIPPKNPAVVMDLDETVLDNSAFETFLYQSDLEYTDDLWADYEEHYPQDGTLIPGARDFIKEATKLGVTVVFLSNRTEKFRKSTEDALQRNGISPEWAAAGPLSQGGGREVG